MSNTDPAANFTTIGAAINAAVVNGHGANYPTVVHVFPKTGGGAYTEDVVLRAGINVVGFSSGDDGPLPIIAGNVSLQDEAGNFALIAMGVNPAANVNGISISGTSARLALFERLNVTVSGSGQGLVSTSTTNAVFIKVIDSTFTAGTPGKPILQSSSVDSFFIDRVTVNTGSSTTEAAISFGGSQSICTRSTFQGQVRISGQVQLYSSQISTSTQALITLDKNAIAKIAHTRLSHSTTDPTDTTSSITNSLGGADITLQNCSWLSNGHRIDPLVSTVDETGTASAGTIVRYSNSSFFGAAPQRTYAGATITLGQPYDLIVVDTKSAGTTVALNLPLASTATPGWPLRIHVANGTDPLKIQPQGSDTIDYASGITYTLGLNAFASFVADRKLNVWVRVG